MADGEAEVPGRRRPPSVGQHSDLVARELVGIRELLRELIQRTRLVDEYVSDVRQLEQLAQTIALSTQDTSRQVTNLESGRLDNARRLTEHDTRMGILERHMSGSRRYQELLHLEEMAPRELEVFPDCLREFLEQQESEVSLQERMEHRMRNIAALSNLINALIALLAVFVAYWIGRH